MGNRLNVWALFCVPASRKEGFRIDAHLPPFRSSESFAFNVNDSFSKGAKDRWEKPQAFTCNLPCMFHLHVFQCSILNRFPLAHYVNNVQPRVIIYTEFSRIMGRERFLSEVIKFTFKSELYLFSYNLSLGCPSDFGNFLCNLKYWKQRVPWRRREWQSGCSASILKVMAMAKDVVSWAANTSKTTLSRTSSSLISHLPTGKVIFLHHPRARSPPPSSSPMPTLINISFLFPCFLSSWKLGTMKWNRWCENSVQNSFKSIQCSRLKIDPQQTLQNYGKCQGFGRMLKTNFILIFHFLSRWNWTEAHIFGTKILSPAGPRLLDIIPRRHQCCCLCFSMMEFMPMNWTDVGGHYVSGLCYAAAGLIKLFSSNDNLR